MIDPSRMNDRRALIGTMAEFRPDVLVIGGWFVPAFNELAYESALGDVPRVLAIDRPRETLLKDWSHKLRHRAYLRRFERVFVAGERCWQFARFLGFADAQIHRGTYGVDYDALAPLLERRIASPGGWPRSFLFMGRYVPVKGLDVLLEAYRAYRVSVADPWSLTVCGAGEQKGMLAGVKGVCDLGFVQPAGQGDVLAGAGVFVMPSRFDPWPLVIVEACAAGLPVVCSSACGSAVELVRSYANGLVTPTGDAGALAAGMRWMHTNADRLPAMGAQSRVMAAPHSATVWAMRWRETCVELAGKGGVWERAD
jgi:glycosyltransferase involved in cell wall biosynthesis